MIGLDRNARPILIRGKKASGMMTGPWWAGRYSGWGCDDTESSLETNPQNHWSFERRSLQPYSVLIVWLVCLAALLLLPVQQTRAAPQPDWADRSYPYVVVDQGVRDVLKQFGRNLSIPVVLAENVDGRIQGRIKADSAEDFLKRICQTNGLAWFYDGAVLYISDQADLQTQSFNLDGVDRAALNAQIEDMKTGRPLDARPAGNTLRVVGPASWIAAVTSLINGSRITSQPSRAQRVRVFRGRAGVETTTQSAPADSR